MMLKCLPPIVNGNTGLLQQSTTEGVKPSPSISFGILKGVKKRPYGDYLWGEYKGNKIEVYDAYKYKQLLIYVSKNLRFLKSKLIYWQDGIKRITRAEGRHIDTCI